MNIEGGKTCGNCTSSARATVRGMEGMLWCQTGQAARRAGIITVQAVYLNPNRAGCGDFNLRVGPIPDAVIEAPQAPAPAAPEDNGQPDESILPWDLPEPTRDKQPEAEPAPNKGEAFSPDFFL
ncbi:hypothetical protein BSFA1_82070 (plasmid) [Burkholderia sp. SFA1]|nr:hypothetical protein [Burkholderia vietnamiensis]BBQ03079.1 hypothetical protein BSFA1_82070 [Burkholderia sp. SFA1]